MATCNSYTRLESNTSHGHQTSHNLSNYVIRECIDHKKVK